MFFHRCHLWLDVLLSECADCDRLSPYLKQSVILGRHGCPSLWTEGWEKRTRKRWSILLCGRESYWLMKPCLRRMEENVRIMRRLPRDLFTSMTLTCTSIPLQDVIKYTVSAEALVGYEGSLVYTPYPIICIWHRLIFTVLVLQKYMYVRIVFILHSLAFKRIFCGCTFTFLTIEINGSPWYWEVL